MDRGALTARVGHTAAFWPVLMSKAPSRHSLSDGAAPCREHGLAPSQPTLGSVRRRVLATVQSDEQRGGRLPPCWALSAVWGGMCLKPRTVSSIRDAAP